MLSFIFLNNSWYRGSSFKYFEVLEKFNEVLSKREKYSAAAVAQANQKSVFWQATVDDASGLVSDAREELEQLRQR